MQRPKLTEDIQPLSEFRANAATLLERVRSTKRPLVLTQRGHSTAVVVDVAEYERLIEELELLRDVRIAERQIADGKGIPHAAAKKQVLSRLPE
jgi:prevent-host-death family protein